MSVTAVQISERRQKVKTTVSDESTKDGEVYFHDY